MKILVFLLTVFMVTECHHRFLGTNFQRPLVYHHDVQYSPLLFRKRIENLYVSLFPVASNPGRSVKVYASTSTHPDDEVEAMYEEISEAVHSSKTSFTVVMGDFNAKVGTRNGDKLKVGSYGYGRRNQRGQRLVDYMEKEGLYETLACTGLYDRGILAYDLTNSGASVNVTQGGIGFNFVNLRMKSDRGKPIHFDVYIYA